jgi:arylsulfatase A-like enzyme
VHRLSWFAILGLLSLFCGLGDLATAAERPPNIVFILADDLGYGDVRCLNPVRGQIPTPHMDRLAAQGMVFTDAHSTSAVCTPSRYALLTGRYNWRTRLQQGVLGGFSPPLIAADRLTLPGLLRQHGYRTACLGKWHLGMTMPGQPGVRMGDGIEDLPIDRLDWAKEIADGPTARGFDEYFGISASLDMSPFAFIEQSRFPKIPTTVKTWVRTGPAAADFEAVDVLPALVRRSLGFLDARARDRSPFLLYLPLTSPHTPVVVSPEWRGRSGLGDYADLVLQTDALVGELMQALDRLGLAENTILVMSSDNGFAPYVEVSTRHEPSGDRRGFKSDTWDGGHHVPLIVRWPTQITPGTRCDQVVGLNDWMATCADLVGATLPGNAGEDSVSLRPLFTDPTCPVRDHLVHHSINGKFAIREGDWKLLLCPGSGGWASPKDDEAVRQGLPLVQLYNLREDVGEQRNLQAQQPERVRRMVARLRQIVNEGRSTPGPRQANDAEIDLWKRKTLPGVTAEQLAVFETTP